MVSFSESDNLSHTSFSELFLTNTLNRKGQKKELGVMVFDDDNRKYYKIWTMPW